MLDSSCITPLFHDCESPWCFAHLRRAGSGYNAGVNNRVRGHTTIRGRGLRLQFSAYLAAASCFAFALVWVRMMCYAAPVADDYVRFGNAHRFGIVAATVNEWYTWGTRSFTILLDHLIGRFGGMEHYAAVLFIEAVAFYLAVAVFTRAAVRVRGAAAWMYPALLLTLYAAGCPDPAETWFWSNGAVEYHLSAAIAMVCGALYVLAARRAIYLIPCCACALVVGNAHEIMATFLMIGVLAHAAATRDRTRSSVVIAALVAGLALNLASPANAYRVAHFPQAFDVQQTLAITSHVFVTQVAAWAMHPVAVCAFLAGGLVSHATVSRWVAPAWLMLCVCVAMPTFGQGVAPEGRVMNIAYLLFTVMLIAAGSRWLKIGAGRTRSAIHVIVAVAILVTGNLPKLIDDSVAAATYRRAWVERHALMTQAAGAGRVVIDDMPTRPYMIKRGYMTDDRRHWINRAVADHYQVESIIVQSRE